MKVPTRQYHILHEALLEDLPTITENIQHLQMKFLDPNAPLDFGSYNLKDITGVDDDEDDDGIVPLEPFKEGMVPQSVLHSTETAPVVDEPTQPTLDFSSIYAEEKLILSMCQTSSSYLSNRIQKHVSKHSSKTNVVSDQRSRTDIVARWRLKKANRKLHPHQPVQYESRKRSALVKPRINGKFVKKEEFSKWQKAHKQLHIVPFANNGFDQH